VREEQNPRTIALPHQSRRILDPRKTPDLTVPQRFLIGEPAATSKATEWRRT